MSDARGPAVRATADAPLLHVRDLTVTFRGAGRPAVAGVGFDVRAGETVGLLGRSGAGKTVTALSILRLLPADAVRRGVVAWKGRDLADATAAEMRALRGRGIGVVFQDPLTSLNPSMRVDRQVAEALRAHDPALSRERALLQAVDLLERVDLPIARLDRSGYPFQWSGGMRQRALFAMAIANRPELIVADEPTTALDVTTQAAILELLRAAQRATGAAVLLITHDIAIMAEVADRIVVLRDGAVAATGTVAEVCRAPRDAYTAALVAPLGGMARSDAPAAPDAGPAGADILSVEGLEVRYGMPKGGVVRAVDGIDFSLGARETLGIVGESGCGKSSLARALLRLEPTAAGRVLLDGADLTRAEGRALRALRARIQIVFQDPYATLNPRRRVGDTIAQPLHIHGRYRSAGGAARVAELMDAVELPSALASRFPHELSGGQRQRVAIARALALEPRVLVLDEPVSSLDAPTRDAILRLLRALRDARDLACILIAHDLRVVRAVADRVAVMYLGRFVEVGPTHRVWSAAAHPYTRALIAAIPSGDRADAEARARHLPRGEVPDAARLPGGCRFHPRCRLREDVCRNLEPALEPRGDAHVSACHFAERLG